MSETPNNTYRISNKASDFSKCGYLGEFKLLLREHHLDAMSFLGRGKARGAVVRNDGQLSLASEGGANTLAHEDEGPNDAHIILLNPVVSLHSTKRAVVPGTHDKRLDHVIQMLAQGQARVAVLSHA